MAVAHREHRDPAKVEAKNVSFVQTVISKVGSGFAYGGGTATNPAKKQAVYQPFEEPGSKQRVDHFPEGENDPFYGAEWNQSAKKWQREGSTSRAGTSPEGGTSTSAKMHDGPDAPSHAWGWAIPRRSSRPSRSCWRPASRSARSPGGSRSRTRPTPGSS